MLNCVKVMCLQTWLWISTMMPKWNQNHAKMDPKWTKWHPNGPKMVPKSSPGGLQMGQEASRWLKRCQDGLNEAPRAPQGLPRWPQDVPGCLIWPPTWPQEGPRWTQRDSRWPQDGPKRLQKGANWIKRWDIARFRQTYFFHCVLQWNWHIGDSKWLHVWTLVTSMTW